MTKLMLGLSTLMLLFSSNQSVLGAGMIYKCQSPDGALIYQKTPCKANADTVATWTPKATEVAVSKVDEQAAPAKNTDGVLVLKQGAGGHYSTQATIEDKSLNFIVDTGASYVSLPEATAHSALIYCDDKINMSTANGQADACTAKIKKLRFGPFQVNDVAAVIVPNLDQPLLGMNVLQLFKIDQHKGEMVLTLVSEKKTNSAAQEHQ